MLFHTSRSKKGALAIILGIGLCILLIATCAACCIVQQNAATSEKKERLKSQIESRGPTSVHEAAHAVASVVLLPDRRIDKVYVAAERSADDKYLGAVSYLNDDCGKLDQAECLRRRAIVMMAGEASEQVMRNKSPPEEYDDKYNAEEMLRERCKITDACAPCPPEKLVGKICPLDVQIEIERDKAFEEAKTLVQERCESIQAFANRILAEPLVDDRHTITGADAEAFIRGTFTEYPLGTCRPKTAGPQPQPPPSAAAPQPMNIGPFWVR